MARRSRMVMKKLLGTIAAVIFCLSATATSAQPVNIWVGFNVGGGFDASARIFARYFPKYLPGNPDVIVRNKPGVGSANLLGWMYAQPQTAGFDIALFHPQVIQIPLYGKRKFKFKPSGFSYIGNMYTDVGVCAVWRGANQNIKTFADIKSAKKPVVFGAARPSSALSTYPYFLKNVFGANLRVINGYQSAQQRVQAMERGELEGTCQLFESTIKSSFRNKWDAGDFNAFIQIDMGKKSSFFGPNTTLLSSLIKTEEQRQIAEFVFGIDTMTRPFLASSSLPKENIRILRKAFMATMRDPALHRDFQKIFGITPDPMDGVAVEKFFKNLVATPKDIVQKAWNITSPSKVKKK